MRSLELIESDRTGRHPKFAFVSPLPGSDTGIAVNSFYTFLDSTVDVDLFTLPNCEDDFFVNSYRFKSGNTRLLHVDHILYAFEIYKYKGIVISVGNSHHHFYVWDVIHRIKRAGLIDIVSMHVHDIVLHNFMCTGRGLTASEYADEIIDLYATNASITKKIVSADMLHIIQEILFDASIYGIRVFSKLGISRFIVNSRFANEMISQDLSGINYSCKVTFLPVFNPIRYGIKHSKDAIEKEEGVTYIGTFGVPGFSKGIDCIIRSVKSLNSLYNGKFRLVVAGYGVDDFFKMHPELLNEFTIMIDSPDDSCLIDIMNIMDIAIQLRRDASGESSGIVPQLLINGKTTIVSPVGAFTDYGESVYYCKELSSSCVEKAIIYAINNPKKNEDIASYIQKRHPNDFLSELMSMI
jgi:hypothetical protein